MSMTLEELQDQAMKDFAAMNWSSVSHTRYRRWCGAGLIYVYKRDPDSPTGVKLLMTGRETPELLALIPRSHSPLSPTEGI